MEVQKRPVVDLIPDPNNARKHDQKNLDAIKGSLAKFGQQKPIVVDKNNIVLAGNGTLAAAKALGWTDIDVVVSTLEGFNAAAYALADNRSSELADWDMEVLEKTLADLKEVDFDIGDIGFEPVDVDELLSKKETETESGEDSVYSKKIEAPIYVPTGPKPSLKDCLDNSKTYQLIEKIDQALIPADEKEFLRWAAYRHAVFNYQNIAEYYAQSPKQVQELMEDSALVIIDFDKAIENGFVKLSNELIEAYEES